MRTETAPLPGDAPGLTRALTRHIWGTPGARPKVHLQAALHADEMPGVLVAQHLMDLLDTAEAAGRITGEIAVVPLANPIGFAQWIAHKPQGRQELESLENPNRHFPDLAALAAPQIKDRLSDDAAGNVALIRESFLQALAALQPRTDLHALRRQLLLWSIDADVMLDLHCDHHATLHFYASPAQPATTSLLARATGATLALIEEVSGGHACDEAHTAPWAALARQFPDAPIPPACFSATLEYRGQHDVDDATARTDAHNLMAFLGAIGAVTGAPAPRHDDCPHLPLKGAVEAFAPVGGVVVWHRAPGDMVRKGEVIADVIDPVTRLRHPVPAPVAGQLFRIELWRSCLRGQGLAHVAGTDPIRQGDLLSD
jgi:predicted deacylase